MIQVIGPDGPYYAIALIPAAHRAARIARAVQSVAAENLLAGLRRREGAADGPHSKAHSRVVAAAALARSGHVGIDVEYRAPGRPIDKIAHYLIGAPVPDEDAAYRAFTFREAYFKAFGDWPEKALMCAAAGAVGARYRLGESVDVLHETVGDDFMLTLVWRA